MPGMPSTAGDAKRGRGRRGSRAHRFASADLVPEGGRNLGVIEDYGATVASRVSRASPIRKTPVAR